MFSCIIYSENLREYIYIPLTVLFISIIVGLLKKEKLAKILYLLSSILFIIYTVCLGGGGVFLLNQETDSYTQEKETHEQSIYKDEYYETHNIDGFTTFNSKFSQYEAEKASGAKVKALIKLVVESNSYLRGEEGKIKLIINDDIIIDGTEIPEELKIGNTKRYSISFKYNDKGLIYLGEIKELEDIKSNTVNVVK